MGILDRMKETDLESDDLLVGDPLPPTSHSTPARVEEPVFARTRYLFEYLIGDIDDGSKRGRRTAFMMRRLINEAYEELEGAPAESLEFYIKKTAAMMYWAATGVRATDVPLPPDFNPDPALEAVVIGLAEAIEQ